MQGPAKLDIKGTLLEMQTAAESLRAGSHYEWIMEAPTTVVETNPCREPAHVDANNEKEGVATADDGGATTEEEEVVTPKEDTVVEAVSADRPTDRSSRKRKLVRERVRTARHSAAVSRLVRSACLWCDRRSQFM